MTHSELAAAGFVIDTDAHSRLSRFVAALLDENQRINLVGTREADPLWAVHICDSLALLPLIRDRRPASLLDLGSGGGLPGVVLACVCPQLQVTVLDATRKKLDAVSRIVAVLELPNVRTVWGRAEERAHDSGLRGAFDGVTARAVAALNVLLEYAVGFLKPGGQAWLYKSVQGAEREVADAQSAAQACGLKHLSTTRYQLPAGQGERAMVVYEKRGPLPAHLPRQGGQIEKRPL